MRESRTLSPRQRLPLAGLIYFSVAGLALLSLHLPAHAEPLPSRVVPSNQPDWPQFRGPRRDGICDETGLLKSWPDGGPTLIWQQEYIGRGYGSPIIVGEFLYITGDVGEDHVIFAFDLDGNLKWNTVNGPIWEKPVPGSRASCTYDDGLLYQMNGHGRVVCLDPISGAPVWAVNILERFDAENIYWGMSECLLFDGNKVIVTPGGPKAFMAALDKKTGETIWTTEPLRFLRTEKIGGKTLDEPYNDCDNAGYTSPLLFEFGSRRLIAGCSARYLFLVDADDPKLIWTYPVVPARWEVIGTMPVLWRDRLVFCAPDFGTRCFRMATGSDNTIAMEEVWEADTDDCHGGFVAIGDRLYGSGYRRSRDWVCIDIETGQTLYNHPDLMKGAVLWADGLLYALAENGTMTLLKPGPDAFETVGQFDLPKGSLSRKKQRDVWAHPVIHNGRLYLRNHDILLCYDIRQKNG